jgi:hypothetical protein
VAVGRHTHVGAWCAALGVLAARAAAASPEATTTARAQALQRVQAIMMQEGLQGKSSGPRAPTNPSADRFELWRNCTCFVCAASPSSGGAGTGDGGGSSGVGNGSPAVDAGTSSSAAAPTDRLPVGVPPNPLLLPHGRLASVQQVAVGNRGSLVGLFALLGGAQGGLEALGRRWTYRV